MKKTYRMCKSKMFVGDLVNLLFICGRRKEIVGFSVIFADKRQK
jgi:hypothetical protein